MLLCLKTWEGFFLEYINSADEDGLELVKTSSQGPISFIVILFYGMRRVRNILIILVAILSIKFAKTFSGGHSVRILLVRFYVL